MEIVFNFGRALNDSKSGRLIPVLILWDSLLDSMGMQQGAVFLFFLRLPQRKVHIQCSTFRHFNEDSKGCLKGRRPCNVNFKKAAFKEDWELHGRRLGRSGQQ